MTQVVDAQDAFELNAGLGNDMLCCVALMLRQQLDAIISRRDLRPKQSYQSPIVFAAADLLAFIS